MMFLVQIFSFVFLGWFYRLYWCPSSSHTLLIFIGYTDVHLPGTLFCFLSVMLMSVFLSRLLVFIGYIDFRFRFTLCWFYRLSSYPSYCQALLIFIVYTDVCLPFTICCFYPLYWCPSSCRILLISSIILMSVFLLHFADFHPLYWCLSSFHTLLIVIGYADVRLRFTIWICCFYPLYRCRSSWRTLLILSIILISVFLSHFANFLGCTYGSFRTHLIVTWMGMRIICLKSRPTTDPNDMVDNTRLMQETFFALTSNGPGLYAYKFSISHFIKIASSPTSVTNHLTTIYLIGLSELLTTFGDSCKLCLFCPCVQAFIDRLLRNMRAVERSNTTLEVEGGLYG